MPGALFVCAQHRAALLVLTAVVWSATACDVSGTSGDGGTGDGAGDHGADPDGSPADQPAGDAMPGDGGAACAPEGTHTGEATYYTFADGTGNCGFSATPADLMIGAMNHVDYAASAVCGACAHLTGPRGSLDIRIVDQCPECKAGDIDLSPSAFDKIALRAAGRVPISWQFVPCGVAGPVVFHFKTGSNPWWTAVQLRNHRHAIATFAYRTAAGAWKAVPRLDYNYFVEASGMGPGPYTFRVTDVYGQAVESSGVVFKEDADVPGTAQFPTCW